MSNEVAVVYSIGDSEIKLTPSIVQNYIVGSNAEISMPEFKMFTELCKVRKLNPFLKEAYCIKYGNEPAQVVVGKDVFVKRAVLHPDYDGKESGLIVKNDKGKIEERQGCFYLDDEEIVGAWARVFRKSWEHPEYVSVAFDEVAKRKKSGELNSNWLRQGATMVVKVATVRALRESFVDDLGGMYVEEEFTQVDNSIVDITPSQDPVFTEPIPPQNDFTDNDQVTLDDL